MESFYPFESDPGCRCFCDRTGKPPGGIALHPYRVFEGPVPFKELLENELPFPITVESNVCAFLQSELLYRTNIENAQNILMLKWGPGVGSATAINGHIYNGI